MIDICQIHCENCGYNFGIEIPNVESVKIEFCPSCGKELKNAVYYEKYGTTMRIKCNDGSLYTVKENTEEMIIIG